MASKQILREVYLTKRLTLTDTEFENRNKSIVDQVIKVISDNGYRHVHTFLPILAKKEINTWPIIEVLRDDVLFSIPKSLKDGQLHHYQLDRDCKLTINKWGIQEPQSGNMSDINTIDLVLVPLIVADKIGNRIGYGKGYYDRFLANSNASKVGVSLLPLLDEIPFADKHDQKLDFCITPQFSL